MNTLVLRLNDAMARDVAKAADVLGFQSHEEVAFEATRLLLQSVLGARRGRPHRFQPLPAAKSRRRGRRARKGSEA